MVNDSLNSDKKLYSTLAYLKIRTIASNRGGYFTFNDAQEVLGNSYKTTLKHINLLVSRGIVLNAGDGYRLICTKDKCLLGLKKQSQRSISIPIEQLLTYSWKSISYFRALFSEIRNEKDVCSIRAIANGFKCHYGEVMRIKNGSFSHFNELYAANRSSKINQISLSTAYSYRKKQELVTYGKQLIERVKFSNGNIRKLNHSYHSQKQKIKIEFLGKYGYNLKEQDSLLLFFNPSPRVSHIPNRRTGIKECFKKKICVHPIN